MRIVLVGHCGPDNYMLKSMVERVLDDAEVHVANDDAALADHQDEQDTWLVNRVLDGTFSAGHSGLDLIKSRVEQLPGARVLLISDLDEHQATAESHGARPGFGKKALYEELSANRLRDAAGEAGL
ncbi:MAG: response regulator [Phycisphaerae bacterium]|nr:response regulator [Phycisphaerae bacterium]